MEVISQLVFEPKYMQQKHSMTVKNYNTTITVLPSWLPFQVLTRGSDGRHIKYGSDATLSLSGLRSNKVRFWKRKT